MHHSTQTFTQKSISAQLLRPKRFKKPFFFFLSKDKAAHLLQIEQCLWSSLQPKQHNKAQKKEKSEHTPTRKYLQSKQFPSLLVHFICSNLYSRLVHLLCKLISSEYKGNRGKLGIEDKKRERFGSQRRKCVAIFHLTWVPWYKNKKIKKKKIQAKKKPETPKEFTNATNKVRLLIENKNKKKNK